MSARPTEEVSESERAYKDGADPRVLDVINVSVIEPKPKTFQSENWLLDPETYWERQGVFAYSQLASAVDTPPSLWINGFHTYHGVNDRVPEADADNLKTSLYLLSFDSISYSVFAPGAPFGNPKRRVHAEFKYAGLSYALWVTDPAIEREFLARDDGAYAEGPCFITVSLGERDKGFCYKLVAAAIRPS